MTGHALPIVVLTGPTASGKTEFALRLAEALGAEIVSADSMQVYRSLDIGTAKPTQAERARVVHHLIDVAEVDEPYSAGRYRDEAAKAIRGIAARGRPCLVVGGTALYVKALLEGLLPGPARDEGVREELARLWDAGEREKLREELLRADPELAARLHPNDRTRILRGIEVRRVTGLPLSSLQRSHGFSERPYRELRLGLWMEREELNARIARRVGRMLEEGWVEEVRSVLAKGYDPSLTSLQAIGYKEICEYLRAGGDLDETAERIRRATRQFAKRQMTWFRRMDLDWLTPGEIDRAVGSAKKHLQIP